MKCSTSGGHFTFLLMLKFYPWCKGFFSRSVTMLQMFASVSSQMCFRPLLLKLATGNGFLEKKSTLSSKHLWRPKLLRYRGADRGAARCIPEPWNTTRSFCVIISHLETVLYSKQRSGKMLIVISALKRLALCCAIWRSASSVSKYCWWRSEETKWGNN